MGDIIKLHFNESRFMHIIYMFSASTTTSIFTTSPEPLNKNWFDKHQTFSSCLELRSLAEELFALIPSWNNIQLIFGRLYMITEAYSDEIRMLAAGLTHFEIVFTIFGIRRVA